MEISWNFVSPKKWEPCQLHRGVLSPFLVVEQMINLSSFNFCKQG